MAHLLEFFQGLRMSSQTTTVPLTVNWGELSVYDPQTHTGKFLLPEHVETHGVNSGNPMETPYIPIGSLIAGAGYGAQFPPPVGAQAVILWVGNAVPIAAVFTYNALETPPFPDGQTSGWKDAYGNAVKTNPSGVTVADGHGNTIVTSAQGVTITDVNGNSVVMSSGNITMNSPHIGLGAQFSSLDPTHSIPRAGDIQTVVNNIRYANQQDILNLILAMQTAGVPSSNLIIAPVPYTVPTAGGSSSIRGE